MKTQQIKKIGVLTSGGDAPGMNAAVRAVVRTGIYHKIEVVGIQEGYVGLIENKMQTLTARDVSDTLQRGGTMLQTARCVEFKKHEGVEKAYKCAKANGIDGLIVIGGDGSFRGAMDLCREGLPTIAMPGTIDNDISCSDYTIGYDTCLNTVVEAVDKIRDTSTSHNRCSIIEVMGRNAGYIALEAGIACGAEVILVPEREWNFDTDVLNPVLESRARGKKHTIIIVAEGIGGVTEMAEKVELKTGIETRATVLGYMQRGGVPTVRDRITASEMGVKCVELLLEGKQNRIVRVKDGKISDIDIAEGLAMKKTLPESLVSIVNKLTV